MMEAVLAYINNKLTEAGVNYEFGEWRGKLVYPYWVGEYSETPSMNEDGAVEATLKLNGFTRGGWLGFENEKRKIEAVFYHNTSILDDGSGVDISYSGSLIVPTGDAELKRMEITLSIKQWRAF